MSITYLKGDATVPQAKGRKIICHICNDLGRWGKGFVMAVSKRWPETRERYLEWYSKRDETFGLGEVQTLQVEKYIWVVNMIGQRGIKTGSKGPPIRYNALEKCLETVNGLARQFKEPPTIHMPRIGCGLAGATWDRVEPIITKTIQFPVYVYDYS